MPTHDYDIANQSGAAFRTDLNNALAAIQSNNSNSSSPATTVAYQWWADTTSGTLKIRNAANNAWIELFQLDGTLTLENGTESSPALAFRDDLNTGIYSNANDQLQITTGGVTRAEFGTTTIFNDSGADVDFRIEGDSNANLFYVDAGNDRVGVRTNTPSDFFEVTHSDNSAAGISITNSNNSQAGAMAQLLIAGGDNSKGRLKIETNGAFHTIDEDNNGHLIIEDNGTERIRLSSAGNLGIGTTHIEAPLVVARDVLESASFNLDNNTMMLRNSGSASAASRTSLYFRTHAADNKLSPSGIRCIADSNYKSILAFHTNGAGNGTGHIESYERMRIDGDGQVGVGTSTLSDRFTIGDGDLKFFHSTAGSAHRTTFIEFGNSSNRITSESNFGSEGSSGYTAGYKFTTKNFDGSAFEDIMALGIQARGHILFGQSSADTAATGARISAISQNPAASYMYRGDAGIVMIFGGGGGSGQVLLDFRHGGTGIGSVSKNGTSNVSYNTSSDYRLKENIVDLTGAITRIKTLQPKRFNWISDETNTLQDGFLAHEVTAVPEAITGTKDAVVTQAMLDSGQVEEMSVGDPIYQQIDQSKLVPLLVAAVQELITKVETLEAA